MKKYAGVGARDTNTAIIRLMEQFGQALASTHMLRSGGARGADSAFEYGCNQGGGKKEIFLAGHCTALAEELSSHYHPNWHACSPIAKKLHGRNAMILLGKDLTDPVDFVICFTRDGTAVGGTGQAIRIAEAHKIPVFNLYHTTHVRYLTDLYLNGAKV